MRLALSRWINIMEIVSVLLIVIIFIIGGLVDFIRTGDYLWASYFKSFFEGIMSSGLFFVVIELIQLKVDSKKKH
ncbi:hypothetical protein HMPREF9103_01269 [Lentilactobacillus parafarraginis F0439]|uniref:Uncharacterized protein n=1 Tax=Lentilactobacillus parafarraginis F0439 TaxID=797515 RepID=G9ZNG6_9LACO|nr:hypothetical protein [Lentilactobacillus parafarraginis]EHL98947.1 hypothetical protein HMPREF9103_01269 [Lentilactobacillus parafarraginis F0439]